MTTIASPEVFTQYQDENLPGELSDLEPADLAAWADWSKGVDEDAVSEEGNGGR